MSYKRDGDDRELLSVHKRRRVGDLLSEKIPEDEASILRDGRITCLVCRRQVTVETMQKLKAHRDGQRHKHNIVKFMKEKEEMKQLVEQRINQAKAEGKDTSLLEKRRKEICGTSTSTTRTSVGGSWLTHPRPRIQVADPQSQKTATNSSRHEKVREFEKTVSSSTREKCLTAVAKDTVKVTLNTIETRGEKDRYFSLKSQGWLRTSSGGWVKDPDAEFDSDEEQPP